MAPQPLLGKRDDRMQTISTAPITIHVPALLKGQDARDPAPAAIASEAPEGTYLLPVTEQNKEQHPAINLLLNLKLVMDGEKKPDQSEAVTLETEQTAAQSPAMKVNSGEYVAHEVKLVPNVNLDPATTPASSAGIQEGMVQGNIPSAVSSQRTRSNGIQQPARNYGVVPSFLIVPKRRVLHNVRSNLKTNVPGTPMARFRQQFLYEHNKKRLLNGVPPLTEDERLNMEAQNFASELAKQRNTTHSLLKNRVGQGENIALRCSFKGSPLTGARATNLWYAESKKFDWKKKPATPAIQRLTPIVWKNTTKVGFGRAQFIDNRGRICFVVVARYEPSVNVGETLLDNKLEPIKVKSKQNTGI